MEGRWDHSNFENWLTTGRVRDSAQILVTGRQASGALFVQSSLDVTPHFRVTLGSRVDGLSTQSTPDSGDATTSGKTALSPKLGALYHLPRLADVYVNVSKGFREPDGVIEDPTLPLITEWAYEGGVKLNASRWSASIALFRMDVSNEQTFDPVTLTSTSGGASRRQGLEVELDVHPANALSLSTDWTFNDARYRQLVTADGDTLNGARVFNTAKYVGTLAVDVGPRTAPWRLRVSSNIVGPYSPFDEPGLVRPAYALLHLSGELRVGAVVMNLGVRNVLNEAYREVEAGGFVSPGQPRSFYGTLRYVWEAGLWRLGQGLARDEVLIGGDFVGQGYTVPVPADDA